MNTQNNDRITTSGSDENNETMDFLAGKLDEATPCPADTGAGSENAASRSTPTADKARD